MIAWPPPFVPSLPGEGLPVRVFDSASGAVRPTTPGPVAGLYVCGITPYDATHLGHAATYVTFDLLNRAWRDAGHRVRYVQNVTDVDDPLLERAEATGEDWRDLAARETALFREDMTALAVLPPDAYVGATEVVPQIVEAVERLVAQGAAYPVAVPDGEGAGPGAADVYFAIGAHERFGQVSGWDRARMMDVFAERGGDPERAGKRDPLDALLWRAERKGEPAWDGGSLGRGRPGWHVECSTIALRELGEGFDVQGGGSDLVFPHHEMSAAHAEVLTGEWPFARSYVHQAMVGLDGEKMSKSRGNLVLVSRLREEGVDPMAIRLALLAHHYRADWTWTDEDLPRATARLARWREALSCNGGPAAEPVLTAIRQHVSDDLDAPGALAAVDRWADEQLTRGGSEEGAPGVVARALDALLGIRV